MGRVIVFQSLFTRERGFAFINLFVRLAMRGGFSSVGGLAGRRRLKAVVFSRRTPVTGWVFGGFASPPLGSEARSFAFTAALCSVFNAGSKECLNRTLRPADILIVWVGAGDVCGRSVCCTSCVVRLNCLLLLPPLTWIWVTVRFLLLLWEPNRSLSAR